jgi:hypothetical protein
MMARGVTVGQGGAGPGGGLRGPDDRHDRAMRSPSDPGFGVGAAHLDLGKFQRYTRGEPGPPDVAVKINHDLARKAMAVAVYREIDLTDYLSGLLCMAVEIHHAAVLREMHERGD